MKNRILTRMSSVWDDTKAQLESAKKIDSSFNELKNKIDQLKADLEKSEDMSCASHAEQVIERLEEVQAIFEHEIIQVLNDDLS